MQPDRERVKSVHPGASREVSRVLIEDEANKVWVSLVKVRSVGTKEHTNDLLQHAKREEIERIFKGRLAARCENKTHGLLRPTRKGWHVPKAGVAVALAA